jgi:hypothetical protein
MKRLLLVLILTLSFQTLTKADDIRDFEIEGVSIGDSLLDYLNNNEINNSFNETKNHYTWLKEPLKFREAYLFGVDAKFEIYENLSFIVNPNDLKYKILFIRGMKEYINDIDSCLKTRNEISNDVENIFNKFDKRESNFKSHLDKSGKSYYKQLVYTFNSGDEVLLSCNDWNEKIRKKNNWTEGLSVAIQTKEISEWWINRK